MIISRLYTSSLTVHNQIHSSVRHLIVCKLKAVFVSYLTFIKRYHAIQWPHSYDNAMLTANVLLTFVNIKSKDQFDPLTDELT